MTDYATPESPAPRTQKSGLTAAEEKRILKEARARMKRAMEADQTDRQRAAKEMRFVWNADNCQWDDEAKKVRKNRPMLTENRNPSFVRQATNEIRRSRPQIRVLPVDGQGDVFTAEVQEGLIRNIEANSRADMAYDQATDCSAYCGRGYFKITTKYQGDGFDQDIVIEPVPDPFSIVDDPDCVYPDKSDRKFAFEVEKVDRDEFEAEYGFKPATFKEASDVLGDETKYWCDEKSVVVANYWRVVTDKSTLYLMDDGKTVPDAQAYIKQAQAMSAIAAVGNPAMAFAPPILPTVKQERELVKRRVEWLCVSGTKAIRKGDWAGQYIPLVYTTCEQMKIDGTFQTKGMTFDGQDLTKANNYLLSAQIENIALTPKIPWIGPKGAFDSDRNKWNNANQENYPFIEYDVVEGGTDGKPLPPPQRSMGATAQPEIATVRMGVIDGQRSVVGLMGASLGDGGPEVAFKAIEARQTKGDTAIFHVMDNVVRAVRYAGMVIVDLIPKVYDAARVIRIINPKGEPVMQAINHMYVDEQGQQRQVNFASGKYDVTVSAGPAFETQRQRDNALIVDLAAKIPAMSVACPDLIAKRLVPGGEGEEIAQRLARTVDPAILGEAPPPQVQQLQQQLQQMQEQMKQLSTQKDFFESELAKQKSLLEGAQVKNDTARMELQRKVAELQGELQGAQLDVQKKDLEVQKAELALARASMPAMQHPAAPPAFPQ